MGKTLFDKVWDSHVVKKIDKGPDVLFIDRHMVHEVTSPVAFLGLKNRDIKVALSDPLGSSLYSHIKNNKLESSGNSITEGIGTGRITKNFDKALVDDAFQTDDVEALNLVYDLIEKQKIVLGGSSGINIAGAIKLAKQLGPGKTIVTILCDHGKRYASKIFNKEFLKSKDLPIPKWL